MFEKFLNKLTGNDQQQNHAEQPEEHPQQLQQVTFDPETLHGTHYDVADFDAEVERRLDYELARRNEQNISESEKNNWRFNLRKTLYQEWTGADMGQTIRWESANSLKHSGIATSGFVKEDNANPLLEPIHGISLKDYAGIALKLTSGFNEQQIFNALGIDKVIFDEVNTLWPKRMQEDSSFTIIALYGQYFSEPITNPKLLSLHATANNTGTDNLEKIRTDRYFYEELAGARQAAYEYGLDGAQWILENYGISLGDFQGVAMHWMTEGNENFDSNETMHYINYQQEKQKEYAAKFAAEQGGNVADDVEF